MALKRFSGPGLLNKHFLGKSPMQVNIDQRETTRQLIQRELDGIRYIKVRERYRYRRDDQDRSVCAIEVGFPRQYDSPRFDLDLDEESLLTIAYHNSEKKKVSTLDELRALAEDCRELAEQRYAKANKGEKIRDLKDKAILARVKKLAREERFSFYTQSGVRKFMLYIRMDNAETLRISIPYKDFQETVPLVRTAILTLRELHQRDIRFRLGQKSPFGRWDQGNWITPESLDEKESEE